MNGTEFDGVVVDYGHGVRAYLPGCSIASDARGSAASACTFPSFTTPQRSWLTSPEKLRRMVCGR